MIERNTPDLSVSEQCQLLSIPRSSYYYQPKGESELNLELMLEIDRRFLETPFYGVKQMTWHLRNEGYRVNEKRIRRLMRLMSLMPIYQKPNTSKSAKGHKLYPYLLRGLRVDHPQSGLVFRYHLFADEAWLSVSGGHHGLAHEKSLGLENIQYLGNGLLS